MVEVEPRELTREESRELLEKAAANMESYILGTNTSLEEVRSDLNLVQKIEGTPIEVEWELDHYEALNLDGSLRLEKLMDKAVPLCLELTANYCEVLAGRGRLAPEFQKTFGAGEDWMSIPVLPLEEEQTYEVSADEA